MSQLASAPDYMLSRLARDLWPAAEIPKSLHQQQPEAIRATVESLLSQNKIVATHYQHVDGTSFAAPIVSSVVVQMLEANPRLMPAAIKHILISTADRIHGAPLMWQGYGVLNARRAVEEASREPHVLDQAHFRPPRVEAGRLVFRYHNDLAEKVALAGDFNDWVLGNLWQQTLSAYVNNPLPVLFKEKLFARLSRYCAVPYCIVCHSCFAKRRSLFIPFDERSGLIPQRARAVFRFKRSAWVREPKAWVNNTTFYGVRLAEFEI